MTNGDFLRVKCDECGNEQVVFSKPSEDVHCNSCDSIIAKSRGGKAQFAAEVTGEVSS